MVNVKKLFEIEAFRLKDEVIEVELFDKNAKTINVRRNKFENWLKLCDCLEYCLDYSEGGEHQQEAGEYPLDEYWEQFSYDKKASDLYDYLAAHITTCEDCFLGAVNKITQEYRQVRRITNDEILKTFVTL